MLPVKRMAESTATDQNIPTLYQLTGGSAVEYVARNRVQIDEEKKMTIRPLSPR